MKKVKVKKGKSLARQLKDKIAESEKDCSSIKSIKDITKKYNYKDEIPRGKGDKKKVACGQDGSYNELQNIYDKILKKHVTSGDITEEAALEALCLCCAELDAPRDRGDYYACLAEKLGIDIS